MNPYGQRAPPKERYVAAIVTPASPQYVVGAADAGDDVAFDGDAPPPVVGVASGAVGYTVVSVEPDLRRVVVLEGLTAESAAARLASGGIAPPLYRHASLDAGFGARGAASAGIAGPTRRLRMEVGNIVAAAAGTKVARRRFDTTRRTRWMDCWTSSGANTGFPRPPSSRRSAFARVPAEVPSGARDRIR